MKKVRHFIKNYPVTILFLILFSSMISTLLIQAKVYAITAKADTEGCKEKYIQCSTYDFSDNINFTCVPVKDASGCSCTGPTNFFVCANEVVRICDGKKWQGCSYVSCEPKDCDSPCSPHCGTCYEYTLDEYPCSTNPANCGNCYYNVTEHVNYLPPNS